MRELIISQAATFICVLTNGQRKVPEHGKNQSQRARGNTKSETQGHSKTMEDSILVINVFSSCVGGEA